MTLKSIALDMINEESHGLRQFKIRETKNPGTKNPRKREDVNFNDAKSSNMYVPRWLCQRKSSLFVAGEFIRRGRGMKNVE
jgi:hypothetical protein